MIEIGMITFGGEVARSPAFKALERLRTALATESSAVTLELVYMVPGSAGRPDFEGFDVGRTGRGQAWPQIFLAVPAAIAQAADPFQDLIDLGRSAIELAQPQLPRKRLDADMTLWMNDLNAVRERELTTSQDGVPRRPVARYARQVSEESNPRTEEFGVSLILPTPDPGSVEMAFDLEQAVDDEFSVRSVDYVDGNEVGFRTFTIFAYGSQLAPLRDAMVDVVQHRWRGPAELHTFDAEGDSVEVLTLPPK